MSTVFYVATERGVLCSSSWPGWLCEKTDAFWIPNMAWLIMTWLSVGFCLWSVAAALSAHERYRFLLEGRHERPHRES